MVIYHHFYIGITQYMTNFTNSGLPIYNDSETKKQGDGEVSLLLCLSRAFLLRYAAYWKPEALVGIGATRNYEAATEGHGVRSVYLRCIGT